MAENLQEQIRESKKVFEENKEFYSNNHCPFLNHFEKHETSIILDEQTFIDLLNEGATELEFKGTATYGGAEHYEYRALYHGKKIALVTENPINEI